MIYDKTQRDVRNYLRVKTSAISSAVRRLIPVSIRRRGAKRTEEHTGGYASMRTGLRFAKEKLHDGSLRTWLGV